MLWNMVPKCYFFTLKMIAAHCSPTQLAITCSNLTTETIKQGVKCSKLAIKIPERRHWRRSGIFIVNFEHILHIVLVFLLLTLSRQMPAGGWVLEVKLILCK